jgi:hypothetical protein
MVKTLLFVLYLIGIIIAICDIARSHELFLKNNDYLANAGEVIVIIGLVICWPITMLEFIINWINKKL